MRKIIFIFYFCIFVSRNKFLVKLISSIVPSIQMQAIKDESRERKVKSDSGRGKFLFLVFLNQIKSRK